MQLQKPNVADETRSGPESTPKLTIKQRKFADAYPIASSGVEAARLAGYQGNAAVLAAQASDNLRNPKIQRRIAEVLDGMTQRALQVLDEALGATTSRTFLDKGVVVYADPVPDNRTRLRAAESVLGLVSKFASVEGPDGSGPHAAGGEGGGGDQLEDADQALLEQAAKIEDELAELDLPEGGGNDHEANE